MGLAIFWNVAGAPPNEVAEHLGARLHSGPQFVNESFISTIIKTRHKTSNRLLQSIAWLRHLHHNGLTGRLQWRWQPRWQPTATSVHAAFSDDTHTNRVGYHLVLDQLQ